MGVSETGEDRTFKAIKIHRTVQMTVSVSRTNTSLMNELEGIDDQGLTNA